MRFSTHQLLPLLFSMLFLFPPSAHAHAPDQSYLYLSIYQDNIKGRYEISLSDINRAVGSQLTRPMTAAAFEPYLEPLRAYIQRRSSFTGNVPYTITFTDFEVVNLEEEEDFVRIGFTLGALTSIPDSLDITYNLLFDVSPNHSGGLIQEHNWKAGVLNNYAKLSAIFDKNTTRQTLDLTNGSVWQGFTALVKLGMWHIWIGLDHILFLVALILPSVVRRRPRAIPMAKGKNWEWVPVQDFKSAFLYILKIVTSFTIAHSITLALASLDIVTLNSRLVESIIAFSIAVAAFHNIVPIFRAREWVITFIFGLFHGFGFASVLGEKGLSGDYMAYSLLGFNIGVEIGQVLIVCMIFPILFLIRKTRFYPHFVLWGSVFLILMALHWVIERAFDFNFKFFDLFKNIFGIS
ncbi:HupE/UreJ family protein [Neolewinella lacunae]|uniref:HupE/UreJ family protein n=1 Tax=Neolewinella lacunae TaxID=1517758 RepID=A0A923TCV0_9BACT|nr:HupE/UreJ family protein [Neolewinella lacunae]MBC6994137.1 HupE/UreJ family protein [Neolewinella lacunae]MDN3636714.1 HupE/UreJ family protein [Neolewinella lacunae]